LSSQKATGLVAFKKDHAKAMLFHDLPDEEAERFADALPKQPWACFSTKAQWDPFNDPQFAGTFGYVYTEADRILPYEMQKLFAQAVHADKSTMLEGSSHSPHLEMPSELASIVIGLVNEIMH
jgi:phytoene dehydrogenase-like protein